MASSFLQRVLALNAEAKDDESGIVRRGEQVSSPSLKNQSEKRPSVSFITEANSGLDECLLPVKDSKSDNGDQGPHRKPVREATGVAETASSSKKTASSMTTDAVWPVPTDKPEQSASNVHLGEESEGNSQNTTTTTSRPLASVAVQAWTATVANNTTFRTSPDQSRSDIGRNKPFVETLPPSDNSTDIPLPQPKDAEDDVCFSDDPPRDRSSSLSNRDSLLTHPYTEGRVLKSILKHLSRSESDVSELVSASSISCGKPISKTKLSKTVSFRDQLAQVNSLAGTDATFHQEECVSDLLVGIKQVLQLRLVSPFYYFWFCLNAP